MGDDGDTSALIIGVNADSHGDAALRAGEGGRDDIALVALGLCDVVYSGECGGVEGGVLIAFRVEDGGICLLGLYAILLGDLVRGDEVDDAEDTGDDGADKEQDDCKLNYLIHYAPSFAAFFAAFSAAMSSLDTPN